MEDLQKYNGADLERCDDKENSENSAINKCLSNIIKKEGYSNYKILKRSISTDGANYFGILHQIDVIGQTSEGNKETNLFIKVKINHNVDNITSVRELYFKEIYVYTELSKVFYNLQEEAGIPLHNRYNIAKSYDTNNESLIILENLTKKGYKTLHRMEIVPLKYMELVISKLSKLHGLSFVLNKMMPNYLHKMNLSIFPFTFNSEWQALVHNLCTQGKENVEINMQHKLTNALPKLLEKLPKYLKGELATVKCLCHGDYRPSNILVKEENGEFIDAIPVDYQTLFYGSPVTDFLYLINSCTDRQFRQNHLEHLKDYYHDSLKEFLQYFHIEVDSIYTRKQFEQDFKDYFDYGLFSSIFFYPFFFVEQGDVPDFGKDGLVNVNMKLGHTFKERMEGVLQDYIDAGLL